MPILDASKTHPMTLPDGTVVKEVVHLARVIDHPRMAVGDFSYYHDFEVKADYAATLAPYLFPFSSEPLVIGRLLQIAHGFRCEHGAAGEPAGQEQKGLDGSHELDPQRLVEGWVPRTFLRVLS